MVKVIIYYPFHFVRGESEIPENIIPMVEFLKRERIKYCCIEESDFIKRIIRKDRNIINFYYTHFLILILRKLVSIRFFNGFESREHFIGGLVRKLTFNKYCAEIIITLSNSMGGFWRGYNSNARIFDYQHGIIDSVQPGFFCNHLPTDLIKLNNKEILLWGKGFADIFLRAGEYYQSRTHVIGYYKPINKAEVKVKKVRNIVVSLQFLPEMGEENNSSMQATLIEIFKEFNLLIDCPNIYLRPHPRHNNILDIQKYLSEFSFLKMNEGKLIHEDFDLHVTFFSTTSFEFGLKGIPTYFLANENVNQGKTVFLEEYKYPIIQKDKLSAQVLLYNTCQDIFLHDQQKVWDWATGYFQNFDTRAFGQLLYKKS